MALTIFDHFRPWKWQYQGSSLSIYNSSSFTNHANSCQRAYEKLAATYWDGCMRGFAYRQTDIVIVELISWLKINFFSICWANGWLLYKHLSVWVIFWFFQKFTLRCFSVSSWRCGSTVGIIKRSTLGYPNFYAFPLLFARIWCFEPNFTNYIQW